MESFPFADLLVPNAAELRQFGRHAIITLNSVSPSHGPRRREPGRLERLEGAALSEEMEESTDVFAFLFTQLGI